MDDGLRKLLTARNFVHLATTLPDAGSTWRSMLWSSRTQSEPASAISETG